MKYLRRVLALSVIVLAPSCIGDGNSHSVGVDIGDVAFETLSDPTATPGETQAARAAIAELHAAGELGGE